MADTSVRDHNDPAWLKQHLEGERRQADLLGDVREAIFGMQDGLVSTLAVVSTVSGATNDRFAILVAGVASALAGVFSMAAGEYLSSKSQREIYVAQIEGEREEVAGRPEEAQAEVAYLFEQEGLTADEARHVAAEIARHPNVLLRTMVEKELGIVIDEGRGPLLGAAIMGGSFGAASLVPLVPFVLLDPTAGFWAALGLSAAVLFVIGFVKSRWTRRNPLLSGAEVVLLAAFAGGAGYLFGRVLPRLLGTPVIP